MGDLYYRVTTHDLRPPVQGGAPIWDGTTPYRLPTVRVDRSPDGCARGWHVSRDPATALRICGLWPDGRPSRLWACEAVPRVRIEDRGDRLRASTWMVLREEPITDAILADMHRPMAGDELPLSDLVAEVQAWRAALARPRRDPGAAEAGLRSALDARGLSWPLVQYDDARAAWAARTWAAGDAWEARAARAWDAASWDAWDAWDAGAAWAATAWAAWDAGAWDAGAWDAWDALTVYVAARRGWTRQRPDLLTAGLRDAYASGLAVALPVQGGLGWAMESDHA